tara:strand:+ start:246 stop:854 length:609 start_codon:yes stop_codon:yes gene_type:complete
MLQGADFYNNLIENFKSQRTVKMLNSRKQQIAEFSLIGFTNSLTALSECAGVDLANISPQKSKSQSNTLAHERSSFGKFAKAIVGLGVLAMCIDNSGCIAGLAGIGSSQSQGKTGDANATSQVTRNTGSTTYSTVGKTTFGSDGTSYRRVGKTLFGSDGTSYRTVGKTTYGSDGTSYRRVGKTTFGSDGASCNINGNTVFCN